MSELFGLLILIISTIAIIYLISFVPQVKEKEKKFLIYPVLTLTSFGILLHTLNFKYIEQFITVCGPILASFNALYIVNISDDKSKEKDISKRKIQLKHILSLIDEGLIIIKKEITNYEDFINQLKVSGLMQVHLKTTPFFLLEELARINQMDFFSTFLVSSKSNEDVLKQAYLKVLLNITNALFIKSSSINQYTLFIESFNSYASDWKNGQFQLNKLYSDISTNRSSSPNFDKEIIIALDNWTNRIQNKTLNFYSITDIRNNLFTPLVHILNKHFFNHQYVAELIQTLKIIEVALDKMEETQNNTIKHFTELKDSLENISKEIENWVIKVK